MGNCSPSKNVSPIHFVMVVNKDEPAALKIDPVVGEVEERGDVEVGVGLFVHVDMPVLVVDCLGRRGRDAGEEGRVGEVQGLGVHPEVLAYCRFHLRLGGATKMEIRYLFRRSDFAENKFRGKERGLEIF